MSEQEEEQGEDEEEEGQVQEAIHAISEGQPRTVTPVPIARNVPVTEEEVQNMMIQLNKPWDSSEHAAMSIAAILGRTLEDALGMYVRMRLSSRHRPGNEHYWNTFHEIVDAGLKVVTALRTAYNWDVLSKQMNTAIAEMEQMKKKGMITEQSYTNIMKVKKKLDQEIESHAA